MNQEMISAIVEEVIKQLLATGQVTLPTRENSVCEDITSAECKASPLLDKAQDPEALERMIKRTTARIGVGRAGPRLKTQTLLALRADHAQARDAVMKDVDSKFLESAGLFTVQTLCEDKNTFITRPDLGRQLSPEAVRTLKERCTPNPDVQIYISDGLSSTAVEANATKILPVITEAWKQMLPRSCRLLPKHCNPGA